MPAPRRPARLILAALALTFTLAPGVSAQLYRWTDAQGETHFGQGPESVPERYRDRSSAIGVVDAPAPPSGPALAEVVGGVTRIAFTPGRPIMVTVRINGRGLAQLMLDTGADATMVSPTALMGLGVSYRDAPRIQLQGVTGASSAYVVVLESVEWAGRVWVRCASSPTSRRRAAPALRDSWGETS
ncbi:MAG TPA: aspartyl protease family protein [Methylomirabilota bacterium]|nr:aspartyl protease family protein [Methylomirabilota bacterium]